MLVKTQNYVLNIGLSQRNVGENSKSPDIGVSL